MSEIVLTCLHRLGLHLSSLTMAILVKFSLVSASFRFCLGGMFSQRMTVKLKIKINYDLNY
jgi:hypothetical protein